jgi:predicted glycoside hydrolase/deacetylase ChbG (UPF0249 family)
MKMLIVNADDFGRTSPINQGIIEAHQKGIVTSASLMTRREAFEEAVTLARSNPRLGVGLHVDLDHFFEVQHGAGRLLSYKDPSLPLQAIVRETEAQIEKIQTTGIRLTHLDSHHHVHLRPELFATMAALAAKHRIPVIRHFRGFYEGLYPGVDCRWTKDVMTRFGLKGVDCVFAGWEAVESSLPGSSFFDPAAAFATAELMVHPGKGEAWREKELARCTSAQTRESLERHEIRLVRFDFVI